jgi:hypothetical protein
MTRGQWVLRVAGAMVLRGGWTPGAMGSTRKRAEKREGASCAAWILRVSAVRVRGNVGRWGRVYVQGIPAERVADADDFAAGTWRFRVP